MHVLALVQKAADNPDRHAVLQEMQNICALQPTPDALRKLDDCRCFPVKTVLGSIEWVNQSADFAIIDRRDYGELFSGKLKILDLSLEEVHSIKSLLDGMGLEGRYLSNTVRQTTAAEDGSLNQGLTEDLRRKSYAICR